MLRFNCMESILFNSGTFTTKLETRIKIQGGHEVDGTPLYVAVGKINGVDAIGKVSIL